MSNFLTPFNGVDTFTLQDPGDEVNLEIRKRGKKVRNINKRVTPSERLVLTDHDYQTGKKRSITQYPDGRVVETISRKQMCRLIP